MTYQVAVGVVAALDDPNLDRMRRTLLRSNGLPVAEIPLGADAGPLHVVVAWGRYAAQCDAAGIRVVVCARPEVVVTGDLSRWVAPAAHAVGVPGRSGVYRPVLAISSPARLVRLCADWAAEIARMQLHPAAAERARPHGSVEAAALALAVSKGHEGSGGPHVEPLDPDVWARHAARWCAACDAPEVLVEDRHACPNAVVSRMIRAETPSAARDAVAWVVKS